MAGSARSHGPVEPFLVSFFDPRNAARDHHGRSLDQILKWNDDMLELRHDYIQFLFPLPEGSIFNSDAPPITKPVFDAFRSRAELRSNLERAFDRILAFYGFKGEGWGSNFQITRAANWRTAFGNWVLRVDHNHLRITRIIRSLRVLGLENDAQAFYKALLKVNRDWPHRIGARSLAFWERAATRPLYLAPDEEDYEPGRKWLREWEEERKKTKSKEDLQESKKGDAEDEDSGRRADASHANGIAKDGSEDNEEGSDEDEESME
jgi:Opioid growth factor receptor (OGFr) conserved region